jgi:stage II sporulation protein D
VKVAVGLMEGRSAVEVRLTGTFTDHSGKTYAPGRYRFTDEVALSPADQFCAFALDDITIGIGFHWERQEQQTFRGALRLVKREAGLSAINDVSLEEYVTSVISSEMSASCPRELLKAQAVISRSWLFFLKTNGLAGSARREICAPDEIRRWYGREAHPDFDVCADDHCQRYQGITKAFSPEVAEAVRATAGELIRYRGAVCDARFAKCCGGITERFATAWEDQDIPYLQSVHDSPAQSATSTPERWIRAAPPAYCNTQDGALLRRILPGFDQETRDFYRWRVVYAPEELGEIAGSRLALDFGPIRDLQALARGPSGRIYRLKIIGERNHLVIGKELEIRRALSPTHLYSSAFVVDKDSGRLILTGAGWGHGVGLCQIGAAVMADTGKTYKEILLHYYRDTSVGP